MEVFLTKKSAKDKSEPVGEVQTINDVEKKPPKRRSGRPSRYSKALAGRILGLVADGKSVRYISRLPSMPTSSTIFKWLLTYEDFSEQYARAKESGAESIADEIFEIADDASNDYMEMVDKNGEFLGWKVNKDAIQRSRLRIDTRKWYLAKLMPKKYGDRVDVVSGGEKLAGPTIEIINYKDAVGKDNDNTA